MGFLHLGNDGSNQLNIVHRMPPICDSHGCSWWVFFTNVFSSSKSSLKSGLFHQILPTPSMLAGAKGGITHSEREHLSAKKVEPQIYSVIKFWLISKSWNELDSGQSFNSPDLGNNPALQRPSKRQMTWLALQPVLDVLVKSFVISPCGCFGATILDLGYLGNPELLSWFASCPPLISN